MHSDRLFSPDPLTRQAARELYESVAQLPLICPHGHVDARLFSDPAASLGSSSRIADHPRSLRHSHVVFSGHSALVFGRAVCGWPPVENNHRKIWCTFCENFHLFRGTPSGLWLETELSQVFGIDEKSLPPMPTGCMT